MQNRALRQYPRQQPANVISTQQGISILEWLEQSGRMMARDDEDFDYRDDEAEINELMSGDDGYDDDDDDSLDLDD